MIPKAKILIVDDEAPLRSILDQTLSDEGYEVKTAANGEEALELVAQEHFNLILMDIVMPQKDGFQTIFELAELNPGINLVVMSGGRSGSQAYLRLAAKIGGCQTLTKPFSRQSLLDVVESGIGKCQLT